MNKNGFTLIELLAVITILAIILLFAIPAVSRTIENSRRDAFAQIAQKYIEAVKAAVISDELICTMDFGATWQKVTEVKYDHHCYFNIQTEEDSEFFQQSKDLMESNNKSPWGKSDLVGTIRFYKEVVIKDDTTETRFHFLIRLKDKAGHGTPSTDFIDEKNLTRQSIVTSGSRAAISSGTASTPARQPYICKLA